MSKIPTAKQFVKKYEREGFLEDKFIEFAKIHVAAALEAASEKAKTKSRKKSFKVSSGIEYDYIISVDKSSILNAYPLDNIKQL